MLRQNARSGGAGCVVGRVEEVRKYGAAHATGRQELVNGGTRAHVSGACHRASLSIRLGAELTRCQELEPDGSPRLESAWPSGTPGSAWAPGNRGTAALPVQRCWPLLPAAQPPVEFGRVAGIRRAVDSPGSRSIECAGSLVGARVR